jgi:hypothetical protein
MACGLSVFLGFVGLLLVWSFNERILEFAGPDVITVAIGFFLLLVAIPCAMHVGQNSSITWGFFVAGACFLVGSMAYKNSGFDPVIAYMNLRVSIRHAWVRVSAMSRDDELGQWANADAASFSQQYFKSVADIAASLPQKVESLYRNEMTAEEEVSYSEWFLGKLKVQEQEPLQSATPPEAAFNFFRAVKDRNLGAFAVESITTVWYVLSHTYGLYMVAISMLAFGARVNGFIAGGGSLSESKGIKNVEERRYAAFMPLLLIIFEALNDLYAVYVGGSCGMNLVVGGFLAMVLYYHMVQPTLESQGRAMRGISGMAAGAREAHNFFSVEKVCYSHGALVAAVCAAMAWFDTRIPFEWGVLQAAAAIIGVLLTAYSHKGIDNAGGRKAEVLGVLALSIGVRNYGLALYASVQIFSGYGAFVPDQKFEVAGVEQQEA